MRSFILSLFMLLSASLASAQSFTNMTDSQSQAFGAAVRAYLLKNPEVIMEAVDVLKQRQQQQDANTDQKLVAQYADQLFSDGYSHVSGNPNGALNIVEFTDYKCGFCKRAYPEILQLLTNNADIRLVLKEYPILGAESVLGSRAAIAIQVNEGEAAYERFHDALMRENGPLTERSLAQIAKGLGLDSEKMLANMNTAVVTQIIQSNRSLGQQMQISGTPTFVVGDQMLRGYVPLAGMQKIVDKVRQSQN